MDVVTGTELRDRTKRYSTAIVKFARTLPSDTVTAVLVRQLVKSGTGVGANYRSACRAKSKRDFISKLAFVEEEADESQFWLELLVESGIAPADSVKWLVNEAEQLVRISVASINTARGGHR